MNRLFIIPYYHYKEELDSIKISQPNDNFILLEWNNQENRLEHSFSTGFKPKNKKYLTHSYLFTADELMNFDVRFIPSDTIKKSFFWFLKMKDNLPEIILKSPIVEEQLHFLKEASREFYSFNKLKSLDELNVTEVTNKKHYYEIIFKHNRLKTYFIFHFCKVERRIIYFQSLYPIERENKTISYIDTLYNENAHLINKHVLKEVHEIIKTKYQLRWLFEKN